MSSLTQGVVTAFVKQVDAKQGRIQVEYSALDDKLESTWAPIASPMSGKGRGAFFMPEKGDEVLVAFHDGKFDSPYVVGFLWNGEHVSPEEKPENRVIVTPGGHQLRFEDKEGDRRVVLKSKGGHSITLEDKEPSKKLEIKSTQHIVTLDDTPGASNISINAGPGGLISIKLNTTPPSVTVTTGAGTVNLGPTGVTVTSPGTLTLTTAGVATVNCSAATINAAGVTALNTGMLSVNSGIATFTGAVQCSALITNAVVSPLYSPGIGNLI
jgi:phage baseplate assembly protein gpV